MNTTADFPMTAAELAETGLNTIRIPGSWDEFWEVLEHSENRVEYQNHEIVLSMSYEPPQHSKIATEFTHVAAGVFPPKQYAVHNPNRPVYIADCQEVFNPDASVVKEPGKVFTYRPGMTAEMSPIVLAEVLSPHTRSRDFREKLPCYKLIPSLQQIIYIEIAHPMVYLYERNGAENGWSKKVLDEMTDSFLLNGQTVTLRDIYARVNFDAADLEEAN
jgi:Uma2 family endonuclease